MTSSLPLSPSYPPPSLHHLLPPPFLLPPSPSPPSSLNHTTPHTPHHTNPTQPQPLDPLCCRAKTATAITKTKVASANQTFYALTYGPAARMKLIEAYQPLQAGLPTEPPFQWAVGQLYTEGRGSAVLMRCAASSGGFLRPDKLELDCFQPLRAAATLRQSSFIL